MNSSKIKVEHSFPLISLECRIVSQITVNQGNLICTFDEDGRRGMQLSGWFYNRWY